MSASPIKRWNASVRHSLIGRPASCRYPTSRFWANGGFLRHSDCDLAVRVYLQDLSFRSRGHRLRPIAGLALGEERRTSVTTAVGKVPL
jgi:hypothetical protein